MAKKFWLVKDYDDTFFKGDIKAFTTLEKAMDYIKNTYEDCILYKDDYGEYVVPKDDYLYEGELMSEAICAELDVIELETRFNKFSFFRDRWCSQYSFGTTQDEFAMFVAHVIKDNPDEYDLNKLIVHKHLNGEYSVGDPYDADETYVFESVIIYADDTPKNQKAKAEKLQQKRDQQQMNRLMSYFNV